MEGGKGGTPNRDEGALLDTSRGGHFKGGHIRAGTLPSGPRCAVERLDNPSEEYRPC